MNSMNLIPTYKVVKYLKSGRRQTLSRGYTEAEAQRIVRTYKSTEHSFVGYTKDSVNRWIKAKKDDSPV